MGWIEFIKCFPEYQQKIEEIHKALKSSHALSQIGDGLEGVANSISQAKFTATHVANLKIEVDDLKKELSTGLESIAQHVLELTAKTDQAIALMPGQPSVEPTVQEPDPAVIEARAQELAQEYAKPIAAQMLRDRLAGLLDVEKAA